MNMIQTASLTDVPEFKQWIQKIAHGAIRDAIHAHGPITPQLTSSAAKRVAGRICGELKAKKRENA